MKKLNSKKKPIKILKKPAGLVRFRFYKPKTEKTEPNPNQKKKPSQTGKKPSQTEKPSQTGFFTGFYPKKPNRNQSVLTGFGFF